MAKPAAVLVGAAVLVTLSLAIRVSSIDRPVACEDGRRVRYAAFLEDTRRADLPAAACVEIVPARSLEALRREVAGDDVDGVLLDAATLYAVAPSDLTAWYRRSLVIATIGVQAQIVLAWMNESTPPESSWFEPHFSTVYRVSSSRGTSGGEGTHPLAWFERLLVERASYVNTLLGTTRK